MSSRIKGLVKWYIKDKVEFAIHTGERGLAATNVVLCDK